MTMHLPAAALIFILSACTTSQPVNHNYDHAFISDVTRIVGENEARIGGSNTPTLIDRLPNYSTNKERTELWAFNSNGNEIVYKISYTSNAKQASNISASFFGYRIVCKSDFGPCFDFAKDICGSKEILYGTPHGSLVPILSTMRDRQGRVMMIINCKETNEATSAPGAGHFKFAGPVTGDSNELSIKWRYAFRLLIDPESIRKVELSCPLIQGTHLVINGNEVTTDSSGVAVWEGESLLVSEEKTPWILDTSTTRTECTAVISRDGLPDTIEKAPVSFTGPHKMAILKQLKEAVRHNKKLRISDQPLRSNEVTIELKK